MSFEVMELIETIFGSFNPEEVFSSVKNFVGSGYVFMAVAGLVVFGIIKKLLKLLSIAVLVGTIWAAANYGLLDSIFAGANISL